MIVFMNHVYMKQNSLMGNVKFSKNGKFFMFIKTSERKTPSPNPQTGGTQGNKVVT